MEPLPKERSDSRGWTPRGRRPRWPQWSRSRRSGATSRPEQPGLAHWCLNGAAPEGAERRPVPAARIGRVGHASMEPLPKERSDGSAPMWHGRRAWCLNGAAPEGAERRGDRLALLERVVASMEPLPKERSDRGLTEMEVSAMGPQWSRSRRSGATPIIDYGERPVTKPQWSRSRRSGATCPLTSACAGC